MIAAAFYLLSVSTGNMKKERDREKDKALATISEKIRETLREAAEEEWSVYYICEEEDVYKIYFPYLQYICNSYEETSRRLSAYELEAYVSGDYEAGTEEWKTEVCEYIEDGGLLHDELSEAGMAGEELIEKEEEDRSTTDDIWKKISSISSSYFNDSQDAIHEIQKAIIIKMAQKGPCVILGRCADVILKEAEIDKRFVNDDLDLCVKNIINYVNSMS